MNAEIEEQANDVLDKLSVAERNIIIDYINQHIKAANEAIECYKTEFSKCCKYYDDISGLLDNSHKHVEFFQKRYDEAEPYYLGRIGSIKLPFGFLLMKPEYKYEKEKKE